MSLGKSVPAIVHLGFSELTKMHVWMPLVKTGTGSEDYTRALTDQLRQRGHTVTLDLVSHFFQYAPWLAPIRPPSTANVILANSWNAAAFTNLGLPTVSVCHLVIHDPRLAPYKSQVQSLFHRYFVLPMEKAAVRRATTNVAVSPLVARQMQRIFGARNVVTVNNGVDTNFFTPSEPPERAPGDPLKLLFVGKPSLRKGFDIATEIVNRLGDRATFTCAGQEPSSDFPRPPGNYTGYLDKSVLRDAYRAADILLFPSRMEGLSLAVAEAMSCGLPILTCEGSAMDDFVDKDAGIVRSEDDIDGFMEDLESVIRQPERHARMRLATQKIASEQLSQNRWLDGIETVLHNSVTKFQDD